MIEQEVVKVLHELGIKEHLEGHKYLVDSILLFQKNNKMEDIYKVLSIKYNNKQKNIERSIRYIINTSFNYKMISFLNFDNYKLTNKKFIYYFTKKVTNI